MDPGKRVNGAGEIVCRVAPIAPLTDKDSCGLVFVPGEVGDLSSTAIRNAFLEPTFSKASPPPTGIAPEVARYMVEHVVPKWRAVGAFADYDVLP